MIHDKRNYVYATPDLGSNFGTLTVFRQLRINLWSLDPETRTQKNQLKPTQMPLQQTSQNVPAIPLSGLNLK